MPLAPGRDHSLTWKILAPLLVVNLLARLFVALRPLECIDGLLLPDDTYISLKIAKNIALGLGPLYGDAYTNGFQPLYVFLSVPFYWIWPRDLVAPVHAALVMLAIFDTLALAFLWRVVARRSRTLAGPLLATAAWIFNPYVIYNSINGLETIIAICFVLLALDRYDALLRSGPGWPRELALGAVIGVAILARIDTIFLLPALGLGLLVRQWRQPGALPLLARQGTLLGLAALAINLPWLLYSFYYTGDIYPVSGRAVRFASTFHLNHHNSVWEQLYRPAITRALEIILQRNQVLLLAVVLLGVVAFSLLAFRAWRGREFLLIALRRRLVADFPLYLFGLLIFLAYTCHVFGIWYFPRYLFPITLGLILLASMLLEAIVARATPAARVVVTTAVLLLLIGGLGWSGQLRRYYDAPPNRDLGYMNLGLWARDYFEPGTAVGSAQTGGLAYFADNLRVINLDGVVNRAGFEALVEGRMMDYIREANIDYVIGWNLNMYYICGRSRNYNESELEWIMQINDFTSWTHFWHVYRVQRDDLPKGHDRASIPAATTPTGRGSS